jgi:hypothetical protein
MRRIVLGGFAAAVLSGMLSGRAVLHAQSAAERLARAQTLTCTFTRMATGTWTDGKVETAEKPATLTLKFVNINLDEGTAQMSGVTGQFQLVVQRSGETVHFMQVFLAGALYMTTVFPKDNPGGKLKAVHSRHEFVDVSLPGFTSRPEQYYGECEPGRP